MAFNEDSRVKLPAIIHLTKLGYKYISLKDAKIDPSTNIFTDIFADSVKKLNDNFDDDTIEKELSKISLMLDYEDLGQAFYEYLTAPYGIKLVDFTNFENNTLHVCTELTYKNGEDEFRPDITLLINGIPLVFIEVKKPNNKEGILAERARIYTRFKNPKFRKFINITQMLVFSNNMEYDSTDIEPIQGAYYATTSYDEASFNYFREEEKYEDIVKLTEVADDVENYILADTNYTVLKHSPEFATNKNPKSPTNRILTSLFSPNRIKMLLKFGIAYVKTEKKLEKHIMRYPQLFATKAIENKLENNVKHGIIWHTQGSGKTALAFYNVNYLTNYYKIKGIVPRFYFIVDRIDLLKQAKREFSSRGLIVHLVSTKEELLQDFKVGKAITNLSGKQEITVVNIHKFKDETSVLTEKDYDTNIQRVYFLDEVHRSYDPKGSFLANLVNSDRDAVIIGLTGTPLIGETKNSKQIFGDYIHKYYYNASIADGYTLKLIREDIETNYKFKLQDALKDIEILKGQFSKSEVFAHKKFVEPMIDYILEDFTNSRVRLGDNTIGGMVVCDSSEQARMLFELFKIKSKELYAYMDLKASLILHDEGTKDDRDEYIEDFKEGRIDLLFVYNMLLTGFDAKRLKKLYLGRVIKDHNLLQTLTRVNRPYKKFRYGYVVDFADITEEFNKTNRAYFDELQTVLGDEISRYSNLFKSQEEIESEIQEIKEKLFTYEINDLEIFSQQISQIQDKSLILDLKKALTNARELYNLIKLQGSYYLLDQLDFKRLNDLLNETTRHLDLLNLKENIKNDVDNTNLLNQALEEVLFTFTKKSEEEMVIADKLKDILKKTRETMNLNIDKEDQYFINLYEELKRLFKAKNLDEVTQEEMTQNIGSLENIYQRVLELNRKNALLKQKYNNDEKYVRLHKRILEKNVVSAKESEIFNILMTIKKQADEKVLSNKNMLDNDGYFERLMTQTVVSNFDNARIKLDPASALYINRQVSKEYLNEYKGTYL